jgi:hypothetical protein
MTREEEIRQEIDLQLAGSFGNYSEGYEEGFIAGAKWADNNPTHCSVRMADSQSYSKQQLREMGFAFDLNGNVLSPNHLAEKAAHYVIEKTCEWLDNIDTDDYMVSGILQMSDLIIDFKKAMEL